MIKPVPNLPIKDTIRVTTFDDLNSIPERYRQLFEVAGEESFFQSWYWYNHLINTIGTEQEKVRIYAVEDDGDSRGPIAALVLRELDRRCNWFRPRILKSYTNFFTYSFSPIRSSESGPVENYVPALIAAICEERRRWDVIQFEAIRQPSPLFDCLKEQLMAQGLMVHPYFQHGIWYQNVNGQSFNKFIQEKSKNFRQVLKRKERRLLREYETKIKIITKPDELEEAISDYQQVYEKSWKDPEQYNDFIPGLLKILARLGKLRLGILYIAGKPVATQLTVLSGRSGIMYKTAYDPQYSNLSVGNIIMLNIVRHVLENDDIFELNFGVGDDEYKRHWLTDRRENWGLMAFNPRKIKGALSATRHLVGPALLNRVTKTGSARK